MFAEAAQAPGVVRGQLARNLATVEALVALLRADPPRAVVTIARGSSDNAATYARYLIEMHLGVLTASAAPSVSSVYGAEPAVSGTLALVISQSGRSPDIVAAARAAAGGGALVVALVNDEGSPLAALADVLLPLGAGAELSVAATKSFIAALSAVAQLVAYWSGNAGLIESADLPRALEAAWALDWSAALPMLGAADHLYTVGRGPGLAVAQEAALKFKETCGLHAEAFSSAEVRHGPMALIGPGFPVLAFVPGDATREGVEETIEAFRGHGASLFAVGGDGDGALPVAPTHPMLEPIVQTQSLYRLVEALAALRGHDPDRPPHLAKVTRTL